MIDRIELRQAAERRSLDPIHGEAVLAVLAERTDLLNLRDRYEAALRHIADTDDANITEPDIGAYLRDMARKALRAAQGREGET